MEFLTVYLGLIKNNDDTHLAVHSAEGELLRRLLLEPDPALARPEVPDLGHDDRVPEAEHPDRGGVHAGGAADVVTTDQ